METVKVICSDGEVEVRSERLRKIPWFASQFDRWTGGSKYELREMEGETFLDLVSVANEDITSTEALIRTNQRASQKMNQLMDFYLIPKQTSDLTLTKLPSRSLLRLLRPYQINGSSLANQLKGESYYEEYLRISGYSWPTALGLALKELQADRLDNFTLLYEYAQQHFSPFGSDQPARGQAGFQLVDYLYDQLFNNYLESTADLFHKLKTLGLETHRYPSGMNCSYLMNQSIYEYLISHSWDHRCEDCPSNLLNRALDWQLTDDQLNYIYDHYGGDWSILLYSGRLWTEAGFAARLA